MYRIKGDGVSRYGPLMGWPVLYTCRDDCRLVGAVQCDAAELLCSSTRLRPRPWSGLRCCECISGNYRRRLDLHMPTDFSWGNPNQVLLICRHVWTLKVSTFIFKNHLVWWHTLTKQRDLTNGSLLVYRWTTFIFKCVTCVFCIMSYFTPHTD